FGRNGPATLSESGLEGSGSPASDWRGRSRRSLVARKISRESVSEWNGHEKEKRVAGSQNLQHELLFFRTRDIKRCSFFWCCLSSQPHPYLAPKLEPLTDMERSLARSLFASQGAPCLQCHATGDPNHDARATAPSFILSKTRLKPDWARRWMLDPSMMSPGTAM